MKTGENKRHRRSEEDDGEQLAHLLGTSAVLSLPTWAEPEEEEPPKGLMALVSIDRKSVV